MEPTLPTRIEAALLALLALAMFLLTGEFAGAGEPAETRTNMVASADEVVDRLGGDHSITPFTGLSPEEPVILTEENRPMIEWALGLYEAAGLDLGATKVGVYDDPAVCGDRRGVYHRGVATICAVHDNPAVQTAWRRHTLLHELAHAWTDLHLSDDTRAALTEARGAATWRNTEHHWEDRAIEHAAEIITWAIADYPVSVHSLLEDRTCAGLAAGYRMLTGNPPPRGYTDHCDSPAPAAFRPEAGDPQQRQSRTSGPGPQIIGASPEQRREITEAIALFAEAGLPLPDLRIYVHATSQPCNGYLGLFNRDHKAHRIDLCRQGSFIALHELVHAWEHHYVTDETRDRFLEKTGLAVWNHADVPWEERGIEAAAHVVAWGLTGDTLTDGEAAEYREQLKRYHGLTGGYSPRYPHPPPQAPVPATANDAATASALLRLASARHD